MITSTQEALVAQLSDPFRKSNMTLFGLVVVAVIFAGSAAVCLYSPANAAPILELAKTALVAVGSVVAVFTGSQAVSERSAAQALGK